MKNLIKILLLIISINCNAQPPVIEITEEEGRWCLENSRQVRIFKEREVITDSIRTQQGITIVKLEEKDKLNKKLISSKEKTIKSDSITIILLENDNNELKVTDKVQRKVITVETIVIIVLTLLLL